MCGIHGIYSLTSGLALDPADLGRMGAVTEHRGPNDEGRYSGEGVLLGMRRLSIIDLEGGQQPIANEDESVWLVCNGEIYNFRALRSALESQGHRFRTGSDAEVLVHLYEEYGDDFVTRLEGMFGFALWDTKRRRLLIGRDRLGIKPLYYLNDGKRLLFASEAKAILAVPGVQAELDDEALREYLTLGYVPGPLSLFAGMAKLPPASLMICDSEGVRQKTYWTLPHECDNNRSEAQWIEAVLSEVESSVKSQMVSDVPLGAFLSGGIDSSAVVAFMARHSTQPVKTYSIGFDTSSGGGSFYNELPWARQVSELFGTEHHEILVEPDVVSLLPKLLWHMDEPMADAAFITTYLVSEFARKDVTVILSGVGGDELFGGYRRYLGEHYGATYNRLPRWLRHGLIAPIARRMPADRHSTLLNYSRLARGFILANELPFEDRYRSYVEVFSDQLADETLTQREGGGGSRFDALKQAFKQHDQGDNLHRLFAVDAATQLPDDLLMLTDKTSMATSLECRVPLLSESLVELAASMPSEYKIKGRELKYILKKSLAGLLPPEILYRKKRGFGAPMGAWLKGELAPLMKNVLSPKSLRSRGLFNPESVAQTIALHESNTEDHTDHLQSLMNLEIWARMYLDGRSVEDVGAELAEYSTPNTAQ